MSGEPFISAKAAARFVGFEPGDGSARRDPAMRAFYEWVRVARVPKHHRGRRCLVFRVSELEAAITGTEHVSAAAATALTRMESLAREHVLRAITGGKGR